MSFKERWKKSRRRNYELSIEELEKRRKNKSNVAIFCIIFSVVFFCVAMYTLFNFADLIISTGSTSNIIIIVAIFVCAVVNILMFHEFKYIMLALDLQRDKDHIDLMIYLKNHLEHKEK